MGIPWAGCNVRASSSAPCNIGAAVHLIERKSFKTVEFRWPSFFKNETLAPSACVVVAFRIN